MGTFALQIAAFIEKTKADADKTVRAIAMGVDGKLVQRSPVGDPSTWKRNPNKAKVFGVNMRVKPGWQTGFVSGGKSNFSMSGAGYVGGRFRSNWQMSIGSPASDVLDTVDNDGTSTLAAHASVVAQIKAGDVVYMVNNLPYAKRLEQGWSKQAPIGMVAVTVVEYSVIVDNAVNGVRAGTSASDFSQGFESYAL